MHFLTIYNLNPNFFSFHVFCPDLRVGPCWFLLIPCQHKAICKYLALRLEAKTWTSEANLCMSDVGESSPAATCIRNILLSLVTQLMSHVSCLLSPWSQCLTCPRCCCSCRAPGGRRTPARPPPGRSPASQPPEATQPGPRSESRRCSRRLSEYEAQLLSNGRRLVKSKSTFA